MARPTKLTPEIQDRIVTAIRAGNYMETAAAYAGIARSTFNEWIRRGAEEQEGPFAEFAAAVEQALAAAEARDVALIGQAAQKEWQAAAWRLERRLPERWGRKTRHEVSAAPGSGGLEAILAHLGVTRKSRDEAAAEAAAEAESETEQGGAQGASA